MHEMKNFNQNWRDKYFHTEESFESLRTHAKELRQKQHISTFKDLISLEEMKEQLERRDVYTRRKKQLDSEGLWVIEEGCCSVCGGKGRTVKDHCHALGLYRGDICPSCNILEGHNTLDDFWRYWNYNNPGFKLKQRIIYKSEFSPFTNWELLNLNHVFMLDVAQVYWYDYNWALQMSYWPSRTLSTSDT